MTSIHIWREFDILILHMRAIFFEIFLEYTSFFDWQ